MPAPTWRINPARWSSTWLGISASLGASRVVGIRVWDQRWTAPLRVSGFIGREFRGVACLRRRGGAPGPLLACGMQAQDAGDDRKRGIRWDAVVPVVLVAGVLVCFSPALTGELLTWDDTANFVENTKWRGLVGENLRWMWTTFHMGHYHPLT